MVKVALGGKQDKRGGFLAATALQAVASPANRVVGGVIGGVALALLAVPHSAFAADAVSTDLAIDASSDANNEIIVTAAKREQTLQAVPIAVSVTTAETVRAGQIRDLRDLQTVVPSLTVANRQNVGNTNFAIRGFGNGSNNAGIEPSVGVFVDNVYRSRSVAQVTDLPNIDRIEVLRGPQSTLFGKNASAGIISITTAEPEFTLGGSAELTYGNYDALLGRARITGPIDDDTAVSLAGGFSKRDGFFENVGTPGDSNDRNRWFVRGQLLNRSADNLRIRIIADYDRIDENCCTIVNLRNGIATPAVIGVGGQTGDPLNPFSGKAYINTPSVNDVTNYGVSGQFDWDVSDRFTLTSITAYRGTDFFTTQDADFTAADLLNPLYQDMQVGTFTQELRLAGELSDRATILLGAFYLSEDVKQNSGLIYGEDFRDYGNLLVQSLSGGALSVPMLENVFGSNDGNVYTGQFLKAGQGFTEKYKLSSRALSLYGQLDYEITERLTLTVGGSYTDDSKKFVTNAVSSDVFSSIDLDSADYTGFRNTLLYQGALAQSVGQALSLGRAATAGEIGTYATNNATAYGLMVTGATNYATANQNNPLANPLGALRALQFMPQFLNLPNAVEDGRTDDDNFSYTARLAYEINSDLNAYVSYATGFKASSINLSRDSRPLLTDRQAIIDAGLSLPNLGFGTRFAAPEKARVMEAGLKANWGTGSANLAVFNQDIKGFQSNIFTGSGFTLRNAGKQSTFGVEFEGNATVWDALQLTLGVTYLDPKYDDFTMSAVGDLSGTRPAGIPTWSVLMGAQYRQEVGNGALIPRVPYLFQSRVQMLEGLPNFVVLNPDGSIADSTLAREIAKEYTREINDLTASLTYELDSGLSLSVWGRNLLDSRNVSVLFDMPAQPRSLGGYANDPRTYGVTARYSF